MKKKLTKKAIKKAAKKLPARRAAQKCTRRIPEQPTIPSTSESQNALGGTNNDLTAPEPADGCGCEGVEHAPHAPGFEAVPVEA